jgi:hypothetical protein
MQPTGRDADLVRYQRAPFSYIPHALQANQPKTDYDHYDGAREEW